MLILFILRVYISRRITLQGNYDPLLAGSRRKESTEEAAARLKNDEAQARAAVG